MIHCDRCAGEMRPGNQPAGAVCTPCLVASQGEDRIDRALEDYIDDLRRFSERQLVAG